MSGAKVYTIILGCLIIIHRLPAVFHPEAFRNIYNRFADRIISVRITGLILMLFSGWGIYENVRDYSRFGWFIIGLSVFILVKACGYLFFPGRTTEADRRANNMRNTALSLVSTAMVIAGVLIVLLTVQF
jgi:hypothetical protein